MTRNVPLSTAKSFAAPKRKLVAAVCMLLISAIALISSTYAWYTLSVAPEARDISTSVAGNGSLEIALVPADGDLTAIKSGRVGVNNDANRNWGNLVNIGADIYGIGEEKEMRLTPMALTVDTSGAISITLPDFGYDGRNKEGSEAGAVIKSYDPEEELFNSDDYGVRAIIDEDSTETEDLQTVYGYVIDLAFRLNAKEGGKLMIEQDATQRIYNDVSNPSNNPATQGQGSFLQFVKVAVPDEDPSATPGEGDDEETTAAEIPYTNTFLNSAVKIAFIQNYAVDGATPEILAYGKAGDDGKIILCDSQGNPRDEDDPEDNLVLLAMEKDTVYQISVVFWLDGTKTTNAAFSSDEEFLTKVRLNLQFTTNTELVPYKNTDLHTPVTTAAPANPSEP